MSAGLEQSLSSKCPFKIFHSSTTLRINKSTTGNNREQQVLAQTLYVLSSCLFYKLVTSASASRSLCASEVLLSFIQTQCSWKRVIIHACWFLYRHNDIMSLVQNYQTIFKQSVGSFRIKDSILIMCGWVVWVGGIYNSLHRNFVVFIMFSCFFLTGWGLPTQMFFFFFSENIFWGMWLTVCHSQLPWPLSICICFSFYWYTLTNCPFHPCVTWPLSILLWERLNCFSYLADWFWLALLSLGSLTGWRGAAVYTIAGKLVNLKCPGIWWRFNTAFACLCSYVSCSAFSTNSQTLYKWENVSFLQ